MVSCEKCRAPESSQFHHLLQVRCSSAAVAPAGPPRIDSVDEYARQMAVREAVRKRNRMVLLAVIAVVVVAVGYLQMKERHRKAVAQEKLRTFETWAEMEKRETGSFWNCVMASEVDVGMFTKAEQFQQRIGVSLLHPAKDLFRLPDHRMRAQDRTRAQSFGGLRDAPTELAGPIEKYRDTLPKLQSGLEDYAEKLKNRGTVKDVDQLIQETGNAWHSTPDPTPEAVAFEKFLYCAVPGLAKMKDAQALLEFLADQCFKKDPVAFMDKVRADCGGLLNVMDKEAKVNPKSVPTWKTTRKLFFEEDARQLQAWESCGKRSRKGKKRKIWRTSS